MYNPKLKEWWIIEGKTEWLREHQRFRCQWLTSILCSPVMQPVQGWVYIQECNRGWMRPTACFLVRAKGGSQLARPYSCLIGLRSLPVAPPALLHGCPISAALREPPPLSMHWADSGYSYRATGDCQLSLYPHLPLSLPPPTPSHECSPLPPPCPCALLRKSFRWELLLCLLPLSIHDTSIVSPSAYPRGLAFLWLMVYVFRSSLKHKRLISLPCGGQERARERRKTTLQKNGLYFSALFTFFIQAEVHVLFKVVWDTGACRSGSCGLENS